MNKIKEIINSSFEIYDKERVQIKTTEQMMKEYAEYYAKKCLEIASENAKIYFNVVQDSIIEIDLPEHE